MSSNFPYLDLLPELRRLIITEHLPSRRDRVAMQRVCSVTHGDDPGPLSSLDPVPLVLAPAFRDFALRVMGEFIDADLDLRQPSLLTVAYDTEIGRPRYINGNHLTTTPTYGVVQFRWYNGSTWRESNTGDDLRAYDVNDISLLYWTQRAWLPMWCSNGRGAHLPVVDKENHVRLRRDDTPIGMRPTDGVAAWTARRHTERLPQMGTVFRSTAWHAAALEAEAQWIGYREIGPPVTRHE